MFLTANVLEITGAWHDKEEKSEKLKTYSQKVFFTPRLTLNSIIFRSTFITWFVMEYNLIETRRVESIILEYSNCDTANTLLFTKNS